MRPLRYSINVTLDGRVGHEGLNPDADVHHHAADGIAQSDAIILGRVTYQLMEAGWREAAETGVRPDWMDEWMMPFARTIHAAKKYVVSRTLEHVDWHNAEILRGDVVGAIRRLKNEPGRGLAIGGVALPAMIAEAGLIDEYEFVTHPTIVGHGPSLLAGLSKPLELTLIGKKEFGSGVVAMRYEPRR
jgi:dihydrofolate reductase